MTKKKITPEQSRAERKHLEMTYCKPIKDVYPNVASICVSYTTSLTETGGWKDKPGGTHNYDPESITLFEYDCPHKDCLGSFNIKDKIKELILNHTSSFSGQKICQYKVRDHPCWVEFDYKINIDYK
jgi:hypothetical protein